MSTKKKPAAKSPSPLLKLKFDKFPEKQIGVYFEPQKRCFYADFGFQQYEASSVSALEQKIKKAIKAGATPDIRWVPVIVITDDAGTYDPFTERTMDTQLNFQAERKYIAMGKKGAIEVDWDVSEKTRMLRANTCYALRKCKTLPKPPYVDRSYGYEVLLPYSDELWQQLRAVFERAAALTAEIRKAIKFCDLSSILKLGAPPAKLKSAKPASSINHPGGSRSLKPSLRPPGPSKSADKKPGENAKGARAKFHREIPDGPLDPALIAKLGYPEGTTVRVSGNMVDIKPPKHVAMLYSRKWLAERLVKADSIPLVNGELFGTPAPGSEQELTK